MRPEKRFFGCSTDVIGLLDSKCSGRKRCQVRIPDADLERTEPCLSHLKMFLEVTYTCMEGACNNNIIIIAMLLCCLQVHNRYSERRQHLSL